MNWKASQRPNSIAACSKDSLSWVISAMCFPACESGLYSGSWNLWTWAGRQPFLMVAPAFWQLLFLFSLPTFHIHTFSSPPSVWKNGGTWQEISNFTVSGGKDWKVGGGCSASQGQTRGGWKRHLSNWALSWCYFLSSPISSQPNLLIFTALYFLWEINCTKPLFTNILTSTCHRHISPQPSNTRAYLFKFWGWSSYKGGRNELPLALGSYWG